MMFKQIGLIRWNLLAIACVLTCVGFIGSCSEEDSLTEPESLAPPKISSLNAVLPGRPLTICAVSASTNAQIEYQFVFQTSGADIMLDWGPDSCQTHSWPSEGQYSVRARVRTGGKVSTWSEDQVVTIIQETIWAPEPPAGDPFVVVGHDLRFCGLGATSDLDHPIEYRFKIEPDHIFDWHIARCSSIAWATPGTFRARAQARCILHEGIVSDWSRSLEFNAVSGADTRIVRVWSEPDLGAGPQTEVDFLDGTPDTIPFGSWVTLIVEGSSPDYDFGSCADTLNYCTGFQIQYDRTQPDVGGSHFVSAWLPFVAFDSNPNGLTDTLRLNIGSVNYDVKARAVDEFSGDFDPSVLPIVGNFRPILDDYYIESHDGAMVRNGDTLDLDWWNPDNGDTVDVGAGERKKVFSFTINASGHDDARDPAGSAIKSWVYFFLTADNPPLPYDFARAGSWVEGVADNTLSDVFTWEVRYPIDDITGDTVFADLPLWINRGWDFAVRGRDSGLTDSFEQSVRVNGQTIAVNEYISREYGRRSSTGFQRFFIQLTR